MTTTGVLCGLICGLSMIFTAPCSYAKPGAPVEEQAGGLRSEMSPGHSPVWLEPLVNRDARRFPSDSSRVQQPSGPGMPTAGGVAEAGSSAGPQALRAMDVSASAAGGSLDPAPAQRGSSVAALPQHENWQAGMLQGQGGNRTVDAARGTEHRTDKDDPLDSLSSVWILCAIVAIGLVAVARRNDA